MFTIPKEDRRFWSKIFRDGCKHPSEQETKKDLQGLKYSEMDVNSGDEEKEAKRQFSLKYSEMDVNLHRLKTHVVG